MEKVENGYFKVREGLRAAASILDIDHLEILVKNLIAIIGDDLAKEGNQEPYKEAKKLIFRMLEELAAE